MDKAGIFSHMARYDFSTPINVSFEFDDSDDECSYQDISKEQTQDNGQNVRRVSDIDDRAEELTCYVDENDNCLATVQKADQTKSIDALHCDDDVSYIGNFNDHISLPYNNITQEAIEPAGNNFDKHKPSYHSEEPDSITLEPLSIVSQHLILIMHPYYHFRQQNLNTTMSPRLNQLLIRLKLHFFDLSYNVVITCILPQEKNQRFINKFIDNTIAAARKVMKWKCERKHVEPLFKELLHWVKQKREYIRNNEILTPTDNTLLKNQLNNPPIAMNRSHENNVPNRNENSNSNTMCIFSTGAPGREISINITPETIKHNSNQINQNSSNEKQNYSWQNNINSQYVSRFPYNLQQNNYFQSHPINHTPTYLRPPPPPYSKQASNTSTPTQYCVNSRMHPRIQEKIAVAMQNYQTKGNNNPYSRAGYFGTHFSQIELQSPTRHIAANDESLRPYVGRCCVCDRITSSKCSKCNDFSYCSPLCQELDGAGFLKRTCKST